jgi:hypothetical protein
MVGDGAGSDVPPYTDYRSLNEHGMWYFQGCLLFFETRFWTLPAVQDFALAWEKTGFVYYNRSDEQKLYSATVSVFSSRDRLVRFDEQEFGFAHAHNADDGAFGVGDIANRARIAPAP